MSDAAKNEILEFLKTAQHGTLGTVDADGKPQTHAMAFVNQGSTLYFATSTKTRKFQNIQDNPNVAFSSETNADNPMTVMGVQLQGTASIVDDAHKGTAGALIIAKYPFMANMPADAGMAFIKVELTEGYMIDYSKGFGHRDHVTFGD